VTKISNRIASRELRLSTLDQVISSISNLAYVMLIAQVSSSAVFAQISTIWVVISFSVVISRSIFGVPLLLDASTTSEGDGLSISGARSGTLLIGVPAFIGSISLYFFAQGDSGLVFLTLAACIPFILLQDFGRYLAIASGRSKDALMSDFALLAPLALVSMLSFSKLQSINVIAATVTLFLGLILSMITLRRYDVLNISMRHLLRLFSNDTARRKKLLQEALLNAFTAVASVAGVWLAFDSNSVAAFNGALYVRAPISLAVLVVNLTLQQSISKSMGVIHKREYGVFTTLLLAAFLWALLVANLPGKTGAVLLGATWALVQPLVIPMASVLCLSLVIEFALVAFRARQQFSLVVNVRASISIITPLVYVIAGLSGYSLVTALYVVALGFTFILTVLYLRLKSHFFV